MANALAEIEVAASPEEVWEKIGGFGSLPDWLPYIPQSELLHGGRVRSLKNPDGSRILERLEAYDGSGRFYSYSILESPFPVQNYQATLSVSATNGGTRVVWYGSFTPVDVTEEMVHELFQKIFENGLASLKIIYAPLTRASS